LVERDNLHKFRDRWIPVSGSREHLAIFPTSSEPYVRVSRIRLKHLPACRVSVVLVSVLDSTAVDENADGASGGGVTTHHNVGVFVLIKINQNSRQHDKNRRRVEGGDNQPVHQRHFFSRDVAAASTSAPIKTASAESQSQSMNAIMAPSEP